MKKREINDLFISWLTISLAFTWVMSNFSLIRLASGGLTGGFEFINILPIALIATGTGFVFHEMAHRTLAKHFGAHAEYRMWPHMLLIAAIFSLVLGVVFAAPGAVYIYGNKPISRKQNGLISLAGPATNIAVAIIAILMNTLVSDLYLARILSVTAYVNLFLALFNLIPIWELDGSKVFKWNPLVWGVFFVPLAAWFLL
ncbi:MAG: site-2 protease family protein [Candidatus Diapherotrites archaeon]|nr:site-2 protease family protein [Candidatus Diapherotrites archaeon]